MNSENDHENSVHLQDDCDLKITITTPAGEHQSTSEAAVSGSPEVNKESTDENIVRVKRTSSIRSLVGYVMMRVKKGETMMI